MIKHIHKIIAVMAVFQLVFLDVQTVFALSIPSANSIASDIERRYHLNKESIQNFGEGFNVSSQKSTPPNITMLFSPQDPKPGEQLTAIAFPSLFGVPNEKLFYTWYLKHPGCSVGSGNDEVAPRDVTNENAFCDVDGDGRVSVNDWKVEAMRILAQNDFESNDGVYDEKPDDTDDKDGYTAKFGGDMREMVSEDRDMPAYCYLLDPKTGIYHELVDGTASSQSQDINLSGVCSSGYHAACVSNTTVNCSGSDSPMCQEEDGVSPICNMESMSTVISDADVSYESGVVSCPTGTLRCIIDSYEAPTCDVPHAQCALYGVEPNNTSCDSATASSSYKGYCKHLFPRWSKGTGSLRDVSETGDGKFDFEEEKFWGTDPRDPDTAQSGNRDEMNIVGVGLDKFKWTYQPGDKVGVVVEGISSVPTKHDDSSNMIMWAFSRNNCPVTNKGQYTQVIKGYNVVIPTTGMDDDDFNYCLKENLVDPREGGQAAPLEISLSYDPKDPINDITENNSGDTLEVVSKINNGADNADYVHYDWSVQISSNGTFNPRGNTLRLGTDSAVNGGESEGWIDITRLLQAYELVGKTKGNTIENISVNLNMTEKVLHEIQKGDATVSDIVGKYFPGGIGYIRVRLTAREFFDNGVSEDEADGNNAEESYQNKRQGKAEIIARVMATNEMIHAYTAKTEANNQGIKVSLGDEICNASVSQQLPDESIQRDVCFITKNEIIGLFADNSEEGTDDDGKPLYKYKDFSWKVNGKTLDCNSRVSSECNDEGQTNKSFFPVIGDIGEQYSVEMFATEVKTGKKINLVRLFEVVEPYALIAPDEENGNMWKKYLGSYHDENNTSFEDYSDRSFQAYANSELRFMPEFHPGFIESRSMVQWSVNGRTVDVESTADDSQVYVDENGVLVMKNQEGEPGHAYNIGLNVMYAQPIDVQKALRDIWGVQLADSAESIFREGAQVELVYNEELAKNTRFTPKALFASLLSSFPSNALFLFQTLLTVGLFVFLFGFMFSVSGSSSNIKRDV